MQTKTLTKILGVGVIALTLAGCDFSKEHSKVELAMSETKTNSIDQVFANSQQEVWATIKSKDGRIMQHLLGKLEEGYVSSVYVRVYKDLPKNKGNYMIEYIRDGEVIEREVHMSSGENIKAPVKEDKLERLLMK